MGGVSQDYQHIAEDMCPVCPVFPFRNQGPGYKLLTRAVSQEPGASLALGLQCII